ncbi:MAG: methyltransferase domain-containing protein [Actinobacteria bacterium]|nr:methyltransferase domain-containing protein [Actinomycetota bacterium]
MSIRQSDYENYDYQEFWKEDKRLYEDCSERIAIRKFLKGEQRNNKLLIDLGCGYGRLFNEYQDFEKIILVDFSMTNLKNARIMINKYLGSQKEKLSHIFFVCADVARLPFKSDCADAVLTVRVIHHLNNPGGLFHEAQRVLKNGGLFMLEFANKRNLKNIGKFFLKKIKVSPFSSEPYQVGETILNFHPKQIKKSLKSENFEIKKELSVSNFRVSFLKKHFSIGFLLFWERFYQYMFSFLELGPSIFLKSVLKDNKIKNNKINDIEFNFLDILSCPVCKNEKLIFEKDGKILCENCSSNFSVDEGIYNFKI